MYRVLFVAENATNSSVPAHDQVIYLSLKNGKMYARDVNEFVQIVDMRTGKAVTHDTGRSTDVTFTPKCLVDRFTLTDE